MTPLYRTIALVQMHDFAMTVAQNLHFDVFGARDVFFQENRIVAERATGFLLRFIEQRLQIFFLLHDTHSAPAAARCRFDNQRKTDLARDFEYSFAVADGIFSSRQCRDVQLLREVARGDFVAHHFQ